MKKKFNISIHLKLQIDRLLSRAFDSSFSCIDKMFYNLKIKKLAANKLMVLNKNLDICILHKTVSPKNYTVQIKNIIKTKIMYVHNKIIYTN